MDWNTEKIAEALSRRAAATRWGIGRKAQYLKSIAPCFAPASGGLCPTQVFEQSSADEWQKAMAEAEQELTYCDEAMEVVETKEHRPAAGGSSVKGALLEIDYVLTSTKSDRDGDVLESKGAKIDKKMPLLWQHIPLQPIGKYLDTIEQDDKRIVSKSVILDTSLGRDAAVLVEAGALRISHGFKALDVEPIYHKDNREIVTGFHVRRFEVLESSLVSVPSNTDAIILAYSREKLHNPLVKSWAKNYYDERPVVVVGHNPAKDGVNPAKDSPGKGACGCQKSGGTDATAAATAGNQKGDKIAMTKDAFHCPNCDVGFELTGVPDGMDLSKLSCPLCGGSMGGKSADATDEKADEKADGKAAGDLATKAGRVLSAKNAGRIKQAQTLLADVVTDAGLDSEATDGGDGEADKSERLIVSKQLLKEFSAEAVKVYIPGDTYSFEGSLEWIIEMLNKSAKAAMSSVVDDECYPYVFATFADSAIVVTSKYTRDGYKHKTYRVGWEVKDGKPTLTGEPKEIEIKPAVVEKAIDLKSKAFAIASRQPSHTKSIIASALAAKDLTTAIATLESAKSEITEALGLAIDQRDREEFAQLGL